jgi:hypothetical protein
MPNSTNLRPKLFHINQLPIQQHHLLNTYPNIYKPPSHPMFQPHNPLTSGPILLPLNSMRKNT